MIAESEAALLGTSVTFGSVIGGFSLTALAILINRDSPLMDRLWNTKYRNDLLSNMRMTTYSSLALVCFSFAGFFVDKQWEYWSFYLGVWLFLLVFSVFCFVENVRITLLILKVKPPVGEVDNENTKSE